MVVRGVLMIMHALRLPAVTLVSFGGLVGYFGFIMITFQVQ